MGKVVFYVISDNIVNVRDKNLFANKDKKNYNYT